MATLWEHPKYEQHKTAIKRPIYKRFPSLRQYVKTCFAFKSKKR